MKISVEHAPLEENEVILRCSNLDQEMLWVLSILRSGLQKLCAWDERREVTLLSPSEVVYCESVDDHTFLYTSAAVYQTALSLAELEGRYGSLGLFRAGKSSIVNLHRVRALKSQPGGRIGWWSPATMRPCCGSGWDCERKECYLCSEKNLSTITAGASP